LSDAPDDHQSLPAGTSDLHSAPTETLLDHVLGRPGVAAHLLESIGNLAALARLSPEALIERFALTPDEATRIPAAFELGYPFGLPHHGADRGCCVTFRRDVAA